MKKNILLFINGLGIEQKDSYSIYSENIMPNFDKLTRTHMFGSISATDLDYKTAYRSFSIGIRESLAYSVVNNSINSETYKNNELFRYIKGQLSENKTRLHILCYYENDNTMYQLTVYLKELLSVAKTNIFVHVLLCQKSLGDYRSIEKNLSTLNYELGGNVKTGIISGENYDINRKDFIKMLVAESGEKWKDIPKKINVLSSSATKPCDTRTFAINDGFALNDNDSLLFFNYNEIDVTPYTKALIEQKYKTLNLGTIRFYSLFPAKCDNVKIPHIYEYAVSSTYTLNSLKSIGAKCLVMSKADDCMEINNYLTGLRNIFDPDIKYMPIDNGFIYDGPTLLNTIKTQNVDLVIVNFDIDDCKMVDDIKERLSTIDKVIGTLYEYTSTNNIGLFISSLFGIEKQMYNSKHELCIVNFSSRVPVLVADKSIDTNKYMLSDGTLYDLGNAVIKNINGSYKIEGIIKKKGGLLSIFKK